MINIFSHRYKSAAGSQKRGRLSMAAMHRVRRREKRINAEQKQPEVVQAAGGGFVMDGFTMVRRLINI